MHFNHLKKTNESYFQHFKNSIYISFCLFKASGYALIHAFYPDWFQSDASSICRNIINNVDERTK